MSLRLRRLVTKIKTINGGIFGLDIPFEDGLVVVRLDNTHGKSTCLNSIAYALGMEKGIGATNRFPFTPVMNKTLEFDHKEYDVLSSEVFLEIYNGQDTYTLRRSIFCIQSDQNIIHVQKCTLDNFVLELSEKYYLHREGDTNNPKGFYNWFCNFINWKLPTVPKTDGGQSLLYPATLFSLFFVEQKRGWTSIQATLPFYLKIKDVKKRTIEYILDLGVHEQLVKKQNLKFEYTNLLKTWEKLHTALTNKARLVRGDVVGFKSQPHKDFSIYSIEIDIKENNKNILLSDLIIKFEVDLAVIKADRSKELTNNLDINLIKNKITEHELNLQVIESNFQDEAQKFQITANNLFSIETRLASLKENKRKYEDLKKINELNVLDGLSIDQNSCPACEQPIEDALLPNILEHDVMSAEESLDFLKNQIKTFNFIFENTRNEHSYQERKVDEYRDDFYSIKTEIRRLKSTITDVSKSNNEELIREEVRLEERLKVLHEVKGFKENTILNLNSLYEEIKKTKSYIDRIPNDGLTKADRKKLKDLTNILIENELDYGFSSFSPNKLSISGDNYLPNREGFDIGFDTSASDNIRIIWGYLMSILELSRDYATNHPGLLIFDEPRQQDADHLSFSSLLKRAANSKKYNQQVILATSENLNSLKAATKGLNLNIIDFGDSDEKIMRPLNKDNIKNNILGFKSE
jgi:hypothetical protein